MIFAATTKGHACASPVMTLTIPRGMWEHRLITDLTLASMVKMRRGDVYAVDGGSITYGGYEGLSPSVSDGADAAFIAAAPDDIAALLARVDALEAALEGLRLAYHKPDTTTAELAEAWLAARAALASEGEP